MTDSNALDSCTTPVTWEQRLECCISKTKHKVNDLVYKAQVNELWKIGVDAMIHRIWPNVCSQPVTVSVGCQMDEQLKLICNTLSESPIHLNSLGDSLDDEPCFELNVEDDNEYHSEAREVDIESVRYESPIHLNPVSDSLDDVSSQRVTVSASCQADEQHGQVSHQVNSPGCSIYHDADSDPSDNQSCNLKVNEEDPYEWKSDESDVEYIPDASFSGDETGSSSPVVADAEQGEEHSKRDNRSRSNKKKSYQCPECDATFSARYAWYMHKRSHWKWKYCKRQLKCLLCSQVFKNLNALSTHMSMRICQRNKIGDSIYGCSKCGKSFPTNAKLWHHSQCHREKKYFCTVCGKGEHEEIHLKRHMLKHTGERPFSCELCSQRFGLAASLKRHVNRVHPK